MNSPLFSILIAQYNNGHFFKDCYNSILNQTYENWEVIIVDDSSTDNSLEIIRDIIKNDGRFKLFLNKKNEGCGYTKRRCAELATGEIFGFLDPDDTLEVSAVEIMVKTHLENPEAAIITSKYYNVDLNLNKIAVSNHGEAIPNGYSYLTFGQGALTHFATFKTKFYQLTNGIDPKFKRAVDQDLYYKLEEVGMYLFIDKPLYNYRINNNSISANQNVFKARFWHFVAMRNAFERRNQNDTKAINFTVGQFKKIKYNYFKKRMKEEAEKRNICNKYYFLQKIIFIDFWFQLKYKLKCLFVPNYA